MMTMRMMVMIMMSMMMKMMMMMRMRMRMMRSSRSFGRIAVTHNTPSGKRYQKKHWHVPKKKGRKKEKKEKDAALTRAYCRPLKVDGCGRSLVLAHPKEQMVVA